ncbi:MAG: hypothetical protein WBA76_02580 [Phormidesmis sp.]
MFVRLIQATAITVALYGLLGLNSLQATTAAEKDATKMAVEPTEMLVALKQALVRRQ